MPDAKRHVALVACDHGFGHVRRVVLFAQALVVKGIDVTIFAPRAVVFKFIDPQDLDFTVIDFKTHTTIEGLIKGEETSANWHKNLESLANFDLVLSDNLPEILDLRPDAILSGGFLWHQALPKMNKSMAERAEQLIQTHKPAMISTRLFADSRLRKELDPHLIGLSVVGTKSQQVGQDLLIACGATNIMGAHFKQAIAEFAQYDAELPFSTVWVDEKLLPPSPPHWMKAARFDETLYERTLACICRPGVGTLTDALWHNARVFCVSEQGNNEMDFNTEQVTLADVGVGCKTVAHAIEQAMSYARQPNEIDKHIKAIERIDFDGVSQMAEFILDSLKRRQD